MCIIIILMFLYKKFEAATSFLTQATIRPRPSDCSVTPHPLLADSPVVVCLIISSFDHDNTILAGAFNANSSNITKIGSKGNTFSETDYSSRQTPHSHHKWANYPCSQ